MIQPAKIQVRYADLDVMEHVNNSVYLTYFEYARVHYFGQLLGKEWDWQENGIILASNQITYIKPILLVDVPHVTIFCEKIGNKSFTLGYEIKVGGEMRATGSSVIVSFDAKKMETTEIPLEMRSALDKLVRNEN
jgi:acyl-CoA thioester hydrolase